ncbi:MAG TPA: hypothetical protein VIM99_07110 [Blastocatellia bacterium]
MSRVPSATQSRSKVVRPIHKIFYASRSDRIRLGRRIGTGAEGEVYEIQNRSDLVAKVYHEPPPPEKAEKLVVLASLGNERLFNLSAWPVSTLHDAPEGEIVGFVMKKISEAEEVHALHSPKSRLQKFPEASWAFLIYVAANIARAVTAIHEHSLVIGDVNPKNILVTRKATVYLLDVDSFQVSVDGKTYRCEGGFPEYTPPELQGVAFRKIDRRQEHDRFGLAVVIFQLLFLGRHPYSGMYLGAGEMPLERAIRESRFAYGVDAEARKMRQPPGALALDSLPPAMVDLFRRAFLSEDRPHPREWIEELDALSKALKKCDLHSGHYYYQELRACPWCGIEKQARVRLFNSLVHIDDSWRPPFRLDEIWKEIENVKAPVASMIQWKEALKAHELSPEIMAFAETRDRRLTVALVFSAVMGVMVNFNTVLPSFLMLILVGIIAYAIAKIDPPPLEKILERRRQAEKMARRLQDEYDRETGKERWEAKLYELRNKKETYENLAHIRRRRIQQLETDARNDRLHEFLDQFRIDDAEIKGVAAPIKEALLSHGVETAADVVEEVERIPLVGPSHARRLLDWRRALEKRFDFDQAIGASPESRIRIEKEVEVLRITLERELRDGVRLLRQMREESEAGKRRLEPFLNQARRELAQAEKELEIAGKRNSAASILIVLVISFIIGLVASF